MKGICARGLWACVHKRKNKARCARAPRHSDGRSTSLHQQGIGVRLWWLRVRRWVRDWADHLRVARYSHNNLKTKLQTSSSIISRVVLSSLYSSARTSPTAAT